MWSLARLLKVTLPWGDFKSRFDVQPQGILSAVRGQEIGILISPQGLLKQVASVPHFKVYCSIQGLAKRKQKGKDLRGSAVSGPGSVPKVFQMPYQPVSGQPQCQRESESGEGACQG